MRCLVVLAHPLEQSLCRHLAERAKRALEDAGHAVTLLDLYAAGFDPRLTAGERASFYDDANYKADGTAADHVAILREVEVLVLVFPTWWFGPPAILKGWIDRIFAPGVAFGHTPNYGPISPLLDGLRHAIAITTLGSPRWIDLFVMRRPVRRILKTAVIGGCAPKARFTCRSTGPSRHSLNVSHASRGRSNAAYRRSARTRRKAERAIPPTVRASRLQSIRLF